jgi:hypothetical protein
MTTFFNYENPERFGVTHYLPDYASSSIVDNLILLNFVELGTSLRRAITVAKARAANISMSPASTRSGQAVSALCRWKRAKACPCCRSRVIMAS